MKFIFFTLALVTAFTAASQSSGSKLHRKAVVVDTHNDVLSSAVIDDQLDISHSLNTGHSDLPRFAKGGVDLQFFSVWTAEKPRTSRGFYADATEEIDSLYAIANRNPKRMTVATSFREVKKGLKKKKLVALIGVEGGHMIEEDLNRIDSLAARGMRYLTLTWNNSTSWAGSAKDETEGTVPFKGLNAFGRDVVKRLNDLGVIVDLSHVGEQAFYDALAVTTRPVILSHSSVWNLCPVFRNLKDDQIKAVAKNGGVICINFYSGFISRKYDEAATYLGQRREAYRDSLIAGGMDSLAARKAWASYFRATLDRQRPTLADMVDHIDYIVRLVGDDHVGLGADYDGVGSVPVGLEDVTSYPAITAELIKRGYSKRSIRKILGGNVLRVMKKNFR